MDIPPKARRQKLYDHDARESYCKIHTYVVIPDTTYQHAPKDAGVCRTPPGEGVKYIEDGCQECSPEGGQKCIVQDRNVSVRMLLHAE